MRGPEGREKGVRGAGRKGGASSEGGRKRSEGSRKNLWGGTNDAGSLHDDPVNQLGGQGKPGGCAHTPQYRRVYEGHVVVAMVDERSPQPSKVSKVVPAQVLLDEMEEGGKERVGTLAVCSG